MLVRNSTQHCSISDLLQGGNFGVSRTLWKNARDFDFSFAILALHGLCGLDPGTTGYPA